MNMYNIPYKRYRIQLNINVGKLGLIFRAYTTQTALIVQREMLYTEKYNYLNALGNTFGQRMAIRW